MPRYFRPLPRLARAMRRQALPAATVAAILADYRTRAPGHSLLADVIRAAFQNRHLSRDWLPYPDRDGARNRAWPPRDPLARIAAKIAIEAPIRRARFAFDTRVSWHHVEALRAELERIGWPWRRAAEILRATPREPDASAPPKAIVLPDLAAWDAFAAENREALESEYGSINAALKHACDGGLTLGGGAAPAFIVTMAG